MDADKFQGSSTAPIDFVYAPTHHFRQTWRFIYIDGKEKDIVLANMDKIYEGLYPIEWKLDYRKATTLESKAILVVVLRRTIQILSGC